MNTQIDLSEYLPEIDKEEDASDDRKLYQRIEWGLFQLREELPWYPFLLERIHWTVAYAAAVSADSWTGDKYYNCGDCSDERAEISIETWTASSRSHTDQLILVLKSEGGSRHWIMIDLGVKSGGVRNYNLKRDAPTVEEFQDLHGSRNCHS